MTQQFDTVTELTSVNSILASIGQSPITRLNMANPEVSFAYQLLMESNLDTQNEGWVFNTEDHYPLEPLESGKIYYPSNVLRMDLCDEPVLRNTDVVKRGDYLYNKLEHTDIWTRTVYADMTWKLTYDDLPQTFQRYITARAATRAGTQMVSNPSLMKMLQQTEAGLRAACIEYECNQGDYTFFGTPHHTAYQPFQPYRMLDRR